MGLAVATLTILFVFSVIPSNAQLNYEGNPLTENTDYTAEESQSVERNSVNQLENLNTVIVNNVPQKLYPVYAKDAQTQNGKVYTVKNATISIEKSVEIDPKQLQTRAYKGRELPNNVIPYSTDTNKNELYVPQQQNYLADYALNSFLQSKTPEESKLALDYYLKSQETQTATLNEPNQLQSQTLQIINNDVLQQGLPYQAQSVDFLQNQNNLQYQQISNQNIQPNPTVNMQPALTSSFQTNSAPVYQSNSIPTFQSNVPMQNFQYPSDQSMQIQPVQIQSQSNYQFQPSPSIPMVNAVNSVNSMIPNSPQVQSYPIQSPQETVPVVYQQPKVPFKYPPPRFSRHQGRPMPRLRSKIPQQRIGPSMIYKSPPPILPQNFPPHPNMGKYKSPEIIYTKPPGYRAPIRHTVPGPYEEASSWYPEVSRPPYPTASPKDIFWSQLYTQSYDPHYYNYIAKTGKIKPHLYGKFHEHAKEDDGILSEMIKGFKKHGLKNIMNPGFLLGMTIPALTLMLTALVQKRSLARADFGPVTLDQEKLDEYMMKVQNALQIFDENKRTSTSRRRR